MLHKVVDSCLYVYVYVFLFLSSNASFYCDCEISRVLSISISLIGRLFVRSYGGHVYTCWQNCYHYFYTVSSLSIELPLLLLLFMLFISILFARFACDNFALLSFVCLSVTISMNICIQTGNVTCFLIFNAVPVLMTMVVVV